MAMMNVQEMRNNKWRIYKSTKQQPKHVVQRTQNIDRRSRDHAIRSPDSLTPAALKLPRAGLINVLKTKQQQVSARLSLVLQPVCDVCPIEAIAGGNLPSQKERQR